MIKPSGSSHWYEYDGTPAYDADLRRARKQGLAPSVTSIIGILDKPAITAWKVNKALDAAFAVKPSEDRESWGREVEALWKAETDRAAELGTAIHDFCESVINGEAISCPEGYESVCLQAAQWIAEHINSAEAEHSFRHDSFHPYAGRIDAFGYLEDGRRFVLDFKTQACKGKKPTYYPEWEWQLAAYKHYLDSARAEISLGPDGLKIDRGPHQAISVVIDTSPEGAIHSREWSEVEMEEALNTFTAIKSAFYAIKRL